MSRASGSGSEMQGSGPYTVVKTLLYVAATNQNRHKRWSPFANQNLVQLPHLTIKKLWHRDTK